MSLTGNPEFAGKVVLITGGASGIGKATGLAFAKAGADVAFTWLTSETGAQETLKQIESYGRRALSIQADMTDPAQVDAAVERTEAELGPISILFTNAGGLLQRSRVVDTSPEFWLHSFAVNVNSTFLACHSVLKRMEPRKSGAIITMSSLAAFDGGGPGASHYAAGKGAILSFTRGLAKEVGPLGIRVNGVAPGLIGTRFHDQFNTPQGRSATVERTPLRREGVPEDVADAVLYLASARASFLSGEVIQINGGLAMF